MSDDLVKRLRDCPDMDAVDEYADALEAQAARIAELEAAVATLMAERDQLIGALQIAVERSGDMEHPPAWVDAACCILNRGFLKVNRAALGEKE